ncbi:MAG: hypothetical protein ACR2J3_09460 [Aridibacter sp.]
MKIFITYIILFLSLVLTACGQEKSADKTNPKAEVNATPLQTNEKQTEVSHDKQTEISPSETYRRYEEAYIKGDIAKIKELASRKTFAELERIAKVQGFSLEEMIRHQSSLIPEDKRGLEIRNEKIDGDRATLEVSNPNNGIWIPVLLIKENGIWKIGDAERIEEVEKTIDEKAKELKKQN